MKVKTFKNLEAVLAHYGWGGETKKEDKNDEDGSKRIPRVGEDSQAKRKSTDSDDVL